MHIALDRPSLYHVLSHGYRPALALTRTALRLPSSVALRPPIACDLLIHSVRDIISVVSHDEPYCSKAGCPPMSRTILQRARANGWDFPRIAKPPRYRGLWDTYMWRSIFSYYSISRPRSLLQGGPDCWSQQLRTPSLQSLKKQYIVRLFPSAVGRN